jgi:hypothetical protein
MKATDVPVQARDEIRKEVLGKVREPMHILASTIGRARVVAGNMEEEHHLLGEDLDAAAAAIGQLRACLAVEGDAPADDTRSIPKPDLRLGRDWWEGDDETVDVASKAFENVHLRSLQRGFTQTEASTEGIRAALRAARRHVLEGPDCQGDAPKVCERCGGDGGVTITETGREPDGTPYPYPTLASCPDCAGSGVEIDDPEELDAALGHPSPCPHCTPPPAEVESPAKYPPAERLVESLRWTVGYIDGLKRFDPDEKPYNGGDEEHDWMEWASAHDWLKDAEISSTTTGASPETEEGKQKALTGLDRLKYERDTAAFWLREIPKALEEEAAQAPSEQVAELLSRWALRIGSIAVTPPTQADIDWGRKVMAERARPEQTPTPSDQPSDEGEKG